MQLTQTRAASNIPQSVARSPTQRFHYISADVTSASENARLFAETTAWNHGRPPDIVWANAGFAVPGLFLDTSIETLRAQMDVNYWGAAYLAQTALRAWLVPNEAAASDGMALLPRHFIMTSSTAAFVGVAGYVPYAPAKAALRSLHDNLQSELNIYHGAATASESGMADVRIHTVFPGTILTPGFEEEQRIKHPITKMLEEEDPPQKEDEVATAAVAALEKGQTMITTQPLMGPIIKGSAWQGSRRDNWLLDTLMQWIMALAWLYVAQDLDKKVWKWGRANGMPKHEKA